MNQIVLVFVAIIIGLVSSCASTDCTDKTLSKLDAKSISELNKAEENDDSALLSIVILLNDELTDEVVDSLSEADVKIIAKTGKIISANATAQSIRKISNYNSIRSIEINKSKTIN